MALIEAASRFSGSAFESRDAVLDAIPSELAALVKSPLLGAESLQFLEAKGSTLRQLLNMGVRYSAIQQQAYALRSDSNLAKVVSTLAARLKTQTFVDGHRATLADVVLAFELFPVLSVIYPASLVAENDEIAPVARWLATVTSNPSLLATTLEEQNLTVGGSIRIGGQVDKRPNPIRVATLADGSIAKNDGHRKAASQRDAEKAAKESAPAAHAATSVAVEVAAPAPSGTVATATQPEENKTLPSKSAEELIAITHARLDSLGFAGKYSTHSHAPANTVQEMLAALSDKDGNKAKNLFVKAKKEKAAGDSRMWLVVASYATEFNLTDLAKKLGYGKIVLRFADAETLLDNLGTVQGHVSPFALANDTMLAVNVAIDAAIVADPEAICYFHPGTNTASTAIKAKDLLDFIAKTGHTVTVVDFTAA